MKDSSTLKGLKEAERDSHWISSNYSELTEKFKGKFVFVKNKEVIAAGDSRKEVIKKAKREGVDVEEGGLTEFIPEENTPLLL